MRNLGDFGNATGNIDFTWHSFNSLGASVAPSSTGTITVYKDNNSASSRVGITATYNTPSGETGIHRVRISMASTTGFYAAGSSYQVVTSGDSIDGQLVRAVLAEFSIKARSGLTLSDVSAAVLDHPGTAPTAVPAQTASVLAKVNYIMARMTNPASFASATGIWQLWNTGSSATIAKRTDVDSDSNYTKGLEA